MRYLLPLVLAFLPCQSFASEPASPPKVAGTWAQLQVQTSVASIPVAGEVVSKTISMLRVEIDQNSKRLKIRSKPCRVEVDSEIEMVRTVVPQAMVDAIGTQEFRARLTFGKTGWVYYQPPVMHTLGVSLTDVWREEMPTRADDPRVIDADADGKPGVTVRVEGVIEGSIYVAQRSWSRLEGFVTKGRIKGSLTWQTDQSVLDATSVLLSQSPQTRPSAIPRANYFRAVQIDPQATCEDILKMPRDLFEF